LRNFEYSFYWQDWASFIAMLRHFYFICRLIICQAVTPYSLIWRVFKHLECLILRVNLRLWKLIRVLKRCTLFKTMIRRILLLLYELMESQPILRIRIVSIIIVTQIFLFVWTFIFILLRDLMPFLLDMYRPLLIRSKYGSLVSIHKFLIMFGNFCRILVAFVFWAALI
jgi:hypothetical protein